MEEMKGKDECCAFDYPNNIAPSSYNQIHYGNRYVPRPTNAAAKVTPAAEVLRSFLEAK